MSPRHTPPASPRNPHRPGMAFWGISKKHLTNTHSFQKNKSTSQSTSSHNTDSSHKPKPWAGFSTAHAYTYLLQDFTAIAGSDANAFKHGAVDWAGVGVLKKTRAASGRWAARHRRHRTQSGSRRPLTACVARPVLAARDTAVRESQKPPPRG